MNKPINRWLTLICSMGILLCFGGMYAFSVFVTPLAATNNWVRPDIMIAFTIAIALSPIPMILGGLFSDKGKTRLVILVGAIMYGLSFVLTGFTSNIILLYLYFGLLGGFGLNIAYSACLSNVLRLFPDKKGLCSGLITAGMGMGTMISAPLANYLIESFDVLFTFKALGCFYLVFSVLCWFFIQAAPAPVAGTTASKPAATSLSWVEMLKTPAFYAIALMFGLGGFSGLMIASNASGIGVSMFQLTPIVAATFVSLYAFMNCFGRIFWGMVSDKIGRINTLLAIFVVIILSMLGMTTLSGSMGFAVSIVGLGLCFGGIMGVIPSLVMDNFGPKNQGVNYGIVFVGYSVAAFFAPSMTAKIAEQNNGDYSQACYIAISLVAVGIIINFIYRKIKRA
ncbi:L-lactate MFS transporter [Zophobihabitans entericus]|uniref:OFA family MFS transporter n=1 Tax=Zophobihabitans entericus TaxID=1635327 RepID=A0A6G9IA09_9GAMM|nr:OFA family MFS transporter [Zophobihabitans entericus]QIQ20564.1 OFA family MFS transporter [Zophobihabitans entericus]